MSSAPSSRRRRPSAAPAVPASISPADTGSSPAAANVPGRITLPKPNPSPAVALFDDEPLPLPAPPRSRNALIAGGIAVVVFASAGYVRTTRRGPEAGDRPAPVVQPQAVASPPEDAGAATKPVPGDPHALRVDLTSLRRVWLRVSVDGRIALEREVAAGEQLPFGADRSIVVRAGDAGAVTVRVGPRQSGAARARWAGRHPRLQPPRALTLSGPGTPRSTDRSHRTHRRA